MNLQRRTMPARRTANCRKEQKSWAFKFYLLIYMLVAATVFFGSLNYRVDLNRKIADMQRSRVASQHEIEAMDREIQALKVTRERLSSWENVSKRIAEYKLPLRQAESHQIRYISGNQLYMQQPGRAQARRTVPARQPNLTRR